jgi:ketosteroid isomerase-like protein
MRAAATIAVLSLSLGAGACSGPTPREFTRADREAIVKSNADLVAAFNAGDLDGIVPLYSPESLFMPPNSPSMRGHDAVRSYFRNLLEEDEARLQMESEEISGHGPIAMQSGTYVLEITRGGKISRDRGKYMRMLRLTAGIWRIEKSMWSSDLPEPTVVAASK